MLVDVGGTLWPDTWPERPRDDLDRALRLRDFVPVVSEAQARALVAALAQYELPAGERQETNDFVAETLARQGLSGAVSVSEARAAMCLPRRGRMGLFPGARELLIGLSARGVRVVIVSNVVWRDADAHRRDFEDVGLARTIAGYVTSVDVGWRKPHPAMFAAALAVAAYPPGECAMVGDSERNDIAPARSLGMFTIRVAIEEPPPKATIADRVVTSLNDVAALLPGHSPSWF